MPVIDLIITKLNGNKKRLTKPPKKTGITVSNNSEINGIEKKTLPNGQEILLISFGFHSKYEPDIGSIEVEGEIAYHEPKLESIMKEEKKGKKKKIVLNDDVFAVVQNTILQESTIQSLIMAKNLQLPPPMQMPHIQVGNEKSSSNKGYA